MKNRESIKKEKGAERKMKKQHARSLESFALRPSPCHLLLLAFLLSPVALAATRFPPPDENAELLETGRATNLQTPPAAPAEIKVVSYNIRWRDGDDLRKLVQLLKSDAALGQAAIIGLQEVDRDKKRTHNTNTARQIAEALGMYYAWAAPPSTRSEPEEETGVEILSPYPLSEVRRILLPVEGPKGRRRVALGATLKIGPTNVRVYSVHAETRISVEQKTQQLRAVLDDLAQYPKTQPAIVLGDFNTWQLDAPRAITKLFFAAEFNTPFTNDQNTFFRKIIIDTFELKLDWLWLRALRPGSYGIERRIELSDHWPLWINARIK
jgi:endonuclease/exonuclease/phosphatase family metal-dependent hydrolase